MTNFEELYEKYANDVLRVSYFYLGDRQRAEDVCQDVFVRLMTNAPDLQEGHEKAWLLKVALNRCRDLWRGAWLKRVTLGSPAFELVPAPDDHQRREDEEAMMSAVHALPPPSGKPYCFTTIRATASARSPRCWICPKGPSPADYPADGKSWRNS